MRITASGNTLTLNINARFTGNSVVAKIKTAMNTAGKGTEKVSKAINKASTNTKSFGGKIKSALSTATTSLNNLRGKVLRAFPLPPINGMIKKLKEMRKNTNDGGKAFNFLKGKVGLLVGAFATFASVSFLSGFAKESVELYKAQNLVEQKLKANIQVVKDYKSETEKLAGFTNIMNKASEIQGYGVLGDELQLAGASQLSTFQLTDKHITQLMPKLADVVANQKGMNATQEDFFNNANMIGKAISTGQLAALRKVGITISDNDMKMFQILNKTERVAMMEKILSENVGDVNKQLRNTPEGKIQAMQNSFGDMKEELGKNIIPLMAEFADSFAPMIPKIQEIGSKIITDITGGIKGAKEAFSNMMNMPDIQKSISNIKQGITSFSQSAGLGNIFGDMKAGASGIFKDIMGVMSTIDFSSIFANIGDGLNSLKGALAPALDLLMSIFKSIDWNGVLQGLSLLFSATMKIINVVVRILAPVLKVVFKALAQQINVSIKVINLILKAVIFVVNGIKSYIQFCVEFWKSAWEGLKTTIVFIWESIKSAFISALAFLVAFIQNPIGTIKFAFESIKTKVIEVFNGIRSKVTEVILNVKNSITNGFNEAKNNVSLAIEGIKTKIGEIITKLGEVIQKVKDAFNPSKWKVTAEITEKVNKIKADENWTGTKNFKGGLTWVAERGAELIQTPNGLPFVAQNQSLQNLPAGTQIWNAQETRTILKSKTEQYKEKFSNSRAGKMLSGVKETYNNITNRNSKSEDTSSNNTTVSKTEVKPTINLTIINNTDTDIQKEVEKALENIFFKMNVLNGEVD